MFSSYISTVNDDEETEDEETPGIGFSFSILSIALVALLRRN